MQEAKDIKRLIQSALEEHINPQTNPSSCAHDHSCAAQTVLAALAMLGIYNSETDLKMAAAALMGNLGILNNTSELTETLEEGAPVRSELGNLPGDGNLVEIFLALASHEQLTQLGAEWYPQNITLTTGILGAGVFTGDESSANHGNHHQFVRGYALSEVLAGHKDSQVTFVFKKSNSKAGNYVNRITVQSIVKILIKSLMHLQDNYEDKSIMQKWFKKEMQNRNSKREIDDILVYFKSLVPFQSQETEFSIEILEKLIKYLIDEN